MTLPAAALDHVLQREGGWRLIMHKADRGGRTYAGVSEKANPDWPGWTWIDEHGPDPDAGRGHLRGLVRLVYERRYWEPMSLDRVYSAAVATQIFSISVLLGTHHAARVTQRAAGVADDGIVGSITIDAINATRVSRGEQSALRSRLALELIAFFSGIVRDDDTQLVFLRGWVNRALLDADVWVS